MKIIFCDNALSTLVNFRFDIIKYFYDQGNNVIIIYPRQTFSEDYAKLFPVGINRIELDFKPTGMSILSDICYLTSLIKIYRKERPDIVFHYTIKPNLYGALAAKWEKINSVAMVAGLGYMFDGNSIGKRLGRYLYKIGLNCSKRVIVLNKDNYNVLLQGNFVKKQNLILFEGGEGVNFNKFYCIENHFHSTRFLMVARILYDKGYSEYVEAASMVKNKYPNIEIELLGSLDEKSPMGVPYSIVKKDINEGKITYLGVTNDVPSIVGRDGVVVVVVSNYLEGMNRSIMEACAMGRPVITTNIPGCKEQVDDGVNGYLIPPKNAKILAEKMLKFIELPQDEKRKMAMSSHQKALSRFDVRLVISKYDQIIKELLN